ncbi:MAG: response regulator [Halioglobus sp.]|nr:response regulator [Halioglobus sp.]
MKTLLIIDDDETFSYVLARSIKKKGFQAHIANDGDTALSMLGEGALDPPVTHVILDLNLAETNGLQLLPRLLATNPALQVVVLTGYASVATTVDAIKQGAVNYLTKPASVDEIFSAFDGDDDSGRALTNANDKIEDNPLSVQRVEWEYIQRQLVANDHNIAATARALGMHRRTLQRKLQKRPSQS